jgi:hypothetical protein
VKRVVPRGGPDPRSLAQFRREVAALLTHGQGFSRTRAISVVAAYDREVRSMWRRGKPPCLASDLLADLERERRRSSRPPGLTGTSGNRPSRRRRRSRTRRDADKPEKGEVYASRYGNRWKVVDVEGARVKVERVPRAPETLLWSKGALRGMRLEKEASRQLSLFGSDPRPGRRSGRGRRSAKAPARRCPLAVSVQSVVFMRRDGWTKRSATAWVRAHGYRAGVDETPTQLRFRQAPPSRVRVVGSRVVRASSGKAIRLLFGCSR